MIAAPELVFSDAELTLLARASGAAGFPCAELPQLDEAGWLAVVRGLAARGVLHDGDDPVVAAGVADLLGVVLDADRSLWVRLMVQPRSGDRTEILWLKDDAIVRQWLDPQGYAHLEDCAPSVLDELRAAVLDLGTTADEPAGDPPAALPEEELVAALGLFASEGVEAVAARHPAAAGYVAALADARLLACVESRRDVEGGVQRDELTLVASPAYGLWLARNASSGTALLGETTTLQRVSAGAAREQMTALLGTVG